MAQSLEEFVKGNTEFLSRLPEGNNSKLVEAINNFEKTLDSKSDIKLKNLDRMQGSRVVNTSSQPNSDLENLTGYFNELNASINRGSITPENAINQVNKETSSLSGLKEAGSSKLAKPTSGGQKFLTNLSGNTQNLVMNWAKKNQRDFQKIPIVGPILKLIGDSAAQAIKQHKKEKKEQLKAAATIGGEETAQAQTTEAATATAKAQAAPSAKTTETITNPHGNVSVTKVAGQPNAYSSTSPKALMSAVKEDGCKSFTINKGPANQSLACMKEGLNLGIPNVKLSEAQERKVLDELTTDTKNPKLNAKNAQALSEYNNLKAINDVNAENNKGKGFKSLSEGNPSLHAQTLATLSDPSSGKANPGAAQYLNTQVPSLTNNDRKDALEILSEKHRKGEISDQQFSEAAKPMLEQMDKKDANSRAQFRSASNGDNNFAKAEAKFNELNPSPALQAGAAQQQTPSPSPTANASSSVTSATTANTATISSAQSQQPSRPLPPLPQQSSPTPTASAGTTATAATGTDPSQPPRTPLPPSPTPTASAATTATATTSAAQTPPPNKPLPPSPQKSSATSSNAAQQKPAQSWTDDSMKDVHLAQGNNAKGAALSNIMSNQNVRPEAIQDLKNSMSNLPQKKGEPSPFTQVVSQALSTSQPKPETKPKTESEKSTNKDIKKAWNDQKNSNFPSLMKNLSNLDLQSVVTQLVKMADTKIKANKSPSSELSALKNIQKDLDGEQKSGKSDRPADKSSKSSAGGYASKAGAPPAVAALVDLVSNKIDDLSKQNKQRKDQNALNKSQGQTSSTPTPSSSGSSSR